MTAQDPLSPAPSAPLEPPEPDTSDIPEADEAWFQRARLRLPNNQQKLDQQDQYPSGLCPFFHWAFGAADGLAASGWLYYTQLGLIRRRA